MTNVQSLSKVVIYIDMTQFTEMLNKYPRFLVGLVLLDL
jgi:hypothetical protein